MENIGERIYIARKSLGLSLEMVGQYVGVTKSTVRKWEQGIIKNMGGDKIKKLSEVLQVSPGYILGWTDDPERPNSRTMEEQLKGVILEQYKSVKSFCATIDIPYTTLDSALKRGLDGVGMKTILKVFNALDLDIDSFRDGALKRKNQSIPGERMKDKRNEKEETNLIECDFSEDENVLDAIKNLNSEEKKFIADFARFLANRA